MLMTFGSSIAGLMLIGVGVLIFIEPDLVAYVIATLLILAGASLIGSGLAARRRVVYRRLDETGNPVGGYPWR